MGTIRDAVLSEEDPPIYRYLLGRVWDKRRPLMVWIMLNPSTADHEVDDRTIQACMEFSRLNGCGGITVVNLFAFRSPHPKVLFATEENPFGPENDTYLKRALGEAARHRHVVVAGWGTKGGYRGREAEVQKLATASGVALMCFGRTVGGHPKHPLARGRHRIPWDAPLIICETSR
ncbi:MAG: DUF1643 domain-containing protein [Acidobacteria bacterium]|nr:DUF1643 domain-containing protein [Acidobacteriota bacterium]